MKKFFLNFSVSFLFTFMLALIISLILAILKNSNSIDDKTSNVILICTSIITFFFLGFIFSLKQKKKGLLNALILILLYVIIYLISNSIKPISTPIYVTIARNGAILLGSLFGVNTASKNGQTC